MSEATDTAGENALTQEEADLAEALRSFREGLPARQRDAFDGILKAAAAHAGAEGEDTQGYFFLSGLMAQRVVATIFKPQYKTTGTDPQEGGE